MQFSGQPQISPPVSSSASLPEVDIGEGLYLATKGPGRFYGRTGSFETGYAFDALVIHMDDMEGLERTPFEKLQQFIYDGDDRNIIARYVDGELVARD